MNISDFRGLFLNISASSTTLTPKNVTPDDRFEIPHIFNIFEHYPWLMWVVLVLISFVILAIVIIFCYCIIHNKKKVIRRGSNQAIVDFDHPTSSCFPCNRSQRIKNAEFIRQNSASNMSPFGRNQPLPPIKQNGIHRPTTSHLPATLGVNISSVKGIPDIVVPPESRRPLPPIRPKTS